MNHKINIAQDLETAGSLAESNSRSKITAVKEAHILGSIGAPGDSASSPLAIPECSCDAAKP